MTDNDTSITQAAKITDQIRKEIAKVLIGQSQIIDEVLIAFIAAGHVLIEGVPGLGKTLLVQALAKTFDGQFSRIQFTPDLMPNDITGHIIYDQSTQKFNIRRGPVFTHLLLADEINRAPAKTQSALLEVMQEQQVSIEGEAIKVPQPFMTLATQNPIEQEGTYPLPESQLDRFLLMIKIDYPSADEEKGLVKTVTNQQIGNTLDVSPIQSIVKPEQIQTLQQQATQVQIDETLYAYAVQIVRTTRNWQGIRTGAGPRGSIALIRAARAAAVLAGRHFMVPDDIKAVTLPTMRHRIILSPELELEGTSTDQVLTTLLEQTKAPRQ